MTSDQMASAVCHRFGTWIVSRLCHGFTLCLCGRVSPCDLPVQVTFVTRLTHCRRMLGAHIRTCECAQIIRDFVKNDQDKSKF